MLLVIVVLTIFLSRNLLMYICLFFSIIFLIFKNFYEYYFIFKIFLIYFCRWLHSSIWICLQFVSIGRNTHFFIYKDFIWYNVMNYTFTCNNYFAVFFLLLLLAIIILQYFFCRFNLTKEVGLLYFIFYVYISYGNIV